MSTSLDSRSLGVRPDTQNAERYTIISADGHAGAEMSAYREYLESRYHDDFDAWSAEYVNPFADLLAPIAYRSWDSDRRLAETESDGIAAESVPSFTSVAIGLRPFSAPPGSPPAPAPGRGRAAASPASRAAKGLRSNRAD